MEIMTRKQAKELNHNKYFTGIICKNGHLDYRYTRSGTCQSCINRKNDLENDNSVAAVDFKIAKMDFEKAKLLAAANVSPESVAQVASEIDLKRNITERRFAISQMGKFKFRCPDVKRSELAQVVWAFASLRFPVIELSDVDQNIAPIDPNGFVAMYTFHCHPEDVPLIFSASSAMVSSYKADIPAILNSIHGAGGKLSEVL